jgi:hypothetical protein
MELAQDIQPEEVRRQCERLRKSQGLHTAPLPRKILDCIVTATLNGKQISGREIATEVYPKEKLGHLDDPEGAVRANIRILRLKLSGYYGGTGAHDPIIITVPAAPKREGYEARFSRNEEHVVAEVSQNRTDVLPQPQSDTTGLGAERLRVPTLESFWNQPADAAFRILPNWRQGIFNELLSKVDRGMEGVEEENRGDLWIVTSFVINWSDLRSRLMECLARGVRIKVLFMNPYNTPLMSARFGIREDGITVEDAAEELIRQLRWLAALPADVEKESGVCNGTLEVRVSELMPSGFVAHSKDWAVFGLMPARASYAEGLMVLIDPNAEPWKKIDADWKARWGKSRSLGESSGRIG